MAVVAVLLIHMERKAVTIMNPSISLQKWVWKTVECVIETEMKRTISSCVILQSRPNSNYQEDTQSDALMEIPVFNSYSHQQTPYEQHVGVL